MKCVSCLLYSTLKMSITRLLVLLATTIIICGVIVAAQSNAVSRCYSFTWLGPRFTNDSIFMNATCQEATRLASGVPCMHPLVVSYDGTWPDVEYIWLHHAQQATCVLAQNDVCAQFTYYFNGHVENSTYMCTRGVDTLGVAVTSGCYEQRSGSSMTRVCFCRPVEGGVPCNRAVTSSMSYVIWFLVFTLLSINIKPFIFT